MQALTAPCIWFVCGSQHLYGEGPLRQVESHARSVVEGLRASHLLPLPLEFKALLTTPDEITQVCIDANATPDCAGLVVWMHTFSPSKMWIRGLTLLKKPFLHLHTQFNRDLPWGSIDMDFMNLNQAAHGDR
ncbi:MAG TPA: L-arabinose isomerase, partial [Opitutaceae bacterium]|nr:L-arabinose isomerase [Opitutaceae bacterium]